MSHIDHEPSPGEDAVQGVGPEPGSRMRAEPESGPGEQRGIPVTVSAAAWEDRAALRLLQIGAIAVIVAVSTNKGFELDRFFVPKEMVLHLTALLAGLFALRSVRFVRFSSPDLLLLGFVAISGISAATAGDRDVALRALAVTVSGLAVFWAARAIRQAGLQRQLIAALGIAVVLGCVTSLLQTYGLRTDLFSLNRAPGGTLGNRNFVAHLAAFGLPVVLYSALRAWRAAGYLLWTGGAMLVVGTLVLTRSRAGWLAAAAVLVVIGGSMLFSPALRRHGRTWRRLAGILLLAGAGVGASLLLPNTLRWRSDAPYLETVRAVANYQEGSGRGRLVQYRRSMEMALDHPVLGVGPGNWPAVYPDYAAPGDPSLSRSRPGTTANPWPSSDWIAFISERGLAAAVLLGAALITIAAAGFGRMARARDPEEGLGGAVLMAVVLGALVAGAFDAVLLLALPTLLVWAALGSLWPVIHEDVERPPWSRWAMSFALLLLVVAAGAGAYRSFIQLSEMGL